MSETGDCSTVMHRKKKKKKTQKENTNKHKDGADTMLSVRQTHRRRQTHRHTNTQRDDSTVTGHG